MTVTAPASKPSPCVAVRCTVADVPDGQIMCRTHWPMVDGPLRVLVYGAFRTRMGSPAAWQKAVDRAVASVADAEGVPLPPALAFRLGRMPAGPLLRPHAAPVADAAAVLARGRRTLDRDAAPPAPRVGQALALWDASAEAVVAVAILAGSIDALDPERLAIVAESEPEVRGPWLWQLDALVPLDAPVPCGRQGGLWPLPDDAVKALMARWPGSLAAARAAAPEGSLARRALDAWDALPAEAPPAAEAPARVTGGAPAADAEVPRVTVMPGAPSWRADEFVILDTETTGRFKGARVVEVATLKVRRWTVVEEFVRLVNPDCAIPADATAVHGITNDMVRRAPRAVVVLPELARFLDGARVLAHNERFDRTVLQGEYQRISEDPPRTRWYCTVKAMKALHPAQPTHSLEPLADALGVPRNGAHRARADTLRLLGLLRATVVGNKGLTFANILAFANGNGTLG